MNGEQAHRSMAYFTDFARIPRARSQMVSSKSAQEFWTTVRKSRICNTRGEVFGKEQKPKRREQPRTGTGMAE